MTFGASTNEVSISLRIKGDTKVEPNENFFFTLSAPTNGATLGNSVATVTIVNDDQVAPPPPVTQIFAQPTTELARFGAGAGGWSSDNLFPRQLADVNGDKLADIVAFGFGGVQVALATGDGHFAQPTTELARFGAGAAAGGWSSDNLFPANSPT